MCSGMDQTYHIFTQANLYSLTGLTESGIMNKLMRDGSGDSSRCRVKGAASVRPLSIQDFWGVVAFYALGEKKLDQFDSLYECSSCPKLTWHKSLNDPLSW